MSANRPDKGFTLVELVISVAITIIIVGAISSALIVFLKNGTYATERDDHSGGAVILASYLNRDLASADTATSPGAACSGGGTGVITLQWTEWTATAAAPEPTPAGGTWRSSYVVTADPAPVTPTRPQRHQLVRRLCPPSGGPLSTVLIDNLPGASTAAAAAAINVTIAGASTDCPGGAIRLRVPAYLNDTTDAYAYGGCLRGRVR